VLAFDLNNYLYYNTDRWDFNDAVFFVEDMAAVPEPTTMLLFGSGLLGLAAFARRKTKQI
jgi:hypothetical protein